MLSISNLNKTYGKLRVLDSINVVFNEGKTTAILGPNASGKSTLIKSILGLVIPDEGDIFFDGDSVLGQWKYRSRIGYMPQIAKFPIHLKVNDIFRLASNLRNENGATRALDHELESLYELDAVKEKRLNELSGGTKQKVNAALAFLFSPEVLILDEPTVGLDPLSVAVIKKKIADEKKEGKTIIITSHILSEVEELADQVVFLLEGKVLYDGSLKSLLNQYSAVNLEHAVVALLKAVGHREALA